MSKGTNINLNKEQIIFLRQRKTLTREKLAIKFNKKYGYLFTKIQMNGICKRLRLRTGRTGCFEKGHASWNKGTTGYTKANKTSFKKGNTPLNHRPVGSERITVDGYVEIKIDEPNKWAFKHVEIWKKENGKNIPKGHIVIFKDCNKLNLSPDNLEAISRNLSLRMNQNNYKKTPSKYKPIIEMVSKIQVKISEKQNSKEAF